MLSARNLVVLFGACLAWVTASGTAFAQDTKTALDSQPAESRERVWYPAQKLSRKLSPKPGTRRKERRGCEWKACGLPLALFKHTQQAPEKAFLFLGLFGLLGGLDRRGLDGRRPARCAALWRCVHVGSRQGALWARRRIAGHFPAGHVGHALPSAVQRARRYRLRPRDVNFGDRSGTVRRGLHSRLGIDLRGDDAVGSLEVSGVAIRAILQGALHELRPDGQRRVGAFQVQLAVIVEAHPDDAQQVGGVAGK